jgi:hypothetical protein
LLQFLHCQYVLSLSLTLRACEVMFDVWNFVFLPSQKRNTSLYTLLLPEINLMRSGCKIDEEEEEVIFL